MGRTTKKSAKATKQAQLKNVAVVSTAKLLFNAKSEKQFQLGLERMQMAIHTGKFQKSKLVEKATKERERIAKRDLEFRLNGIRTVSDYSVLATIYNTELRNMTIDVFMKEASMKAAAFIGKARGSVTAEQERVIIDNFVGEANASFAEVDSIYELLIMKKAIAREVVKQVAEPVLETVTE